MRTITNERGAALPAVLFVLAIMLITLLAVFHWAAGDAVLVQRAAQVWTVL